MGNGLLIATALVQVFAHFVGTVYPLVLELQNTKPSGETISQIEQQNKNTRLTHVVLFLQNIQESLRIFHVVRVLELLRGVRDGRHFVLQLAERRQHFRLAQGQLIRNDRSEVQTLANVHRVVGEVRLVDHLQDVRP